ncbi:sensor domain-containing diguanylate cyclase [Aureimonas sp. ME7]|uniref:GGDEF domain-containing protein n=1 Tax=Aureimonas sp. ME7 TaxID=2744252 RepID=UPI0015FAA927|nr:sensor domain-containing diguanylate cyclase [Aureimonas sp. ME7]
MPMNLDLNQLAVPVVIASVEGEDHFRVVGMNGAAEREFELSNAIVAGRLFDDCFDARLAASLTGRYRVCARTGKAQQFEEFIDLPNGRRWFRTTISPCLAAQSGVVVRIMSVSQDITMMKRLHRKLQEFAYQDPLTGLANRRGFDQAVENACDEAVYSGDGFSLAVVDLDELKVINDTHGHQVGDDVIRFVSQTLSSFLTSGELAARVGGDEFYLLLREPTRDDLDHRLDRLRAIVDQGLYTSSLDAAITLSVGGAAWQPGDDAHHVLADADAQMYAEKGIRRLVRFIDQRMSSVAA